MLALLSDRSKEIPVASLVPLHRLDYAELAVSRSSYRRSFVKEESSNRNLKFLFLVKIGRKTAANSTPSPPLLYAPAA